MLENRHGLCVTCDNEPNCMYQRVPGRTVFYCEHFWQESPAPPPALNDDCGWSRPAPSSNGFHGLCGNCEHRRQCTLQTVEGGVWHCEEYC